MLKKKSRQTLDNNIINNSNNFNNIFNSNIALNINRNNNRNSNRNYNRNDNRNNDRNSNRNNNNLLTNSSKSQDKKTIEKVKQIMEYNEDEINTLEFHLALLFDKRSYCQYYISLLRTKHNFIFSFCHNNDYNSKIIKIDLFFIGFTIYYTVNALFYSEGTLHNIYVSNGSFNIEYQLPKIVYSSLISMVLNTVLKLLALSNSGILEFKQNKSKIDVNERGEELKNKLRIKFLLFFTISFIFLLFFWYYISMFGAIYRNTQLHLLKDTLVSFALSLLYPFGIYLIPGFFRIPALSEPKKKRQCLYRISRLLQIL